MGFVAVIINLILVGVTERVSCGIWIFLNLISCFTSVCFYIVLPRGLFWSTESVLLMNLGFLGKEIKWIFAAVSVKMPPDFFTYIFLHFYNSMLLQNFWLNKVHWTKWKDGVGQRKLYRKHIYTWPFSALKGWCADRQNLCPSKRPEKLLELHLK